MSGFGRKGVGAGGGDEGAPTMRPVPPRVQARSPMAPATQRGDMSPQARAFLEAERQRRGEPEQARAPMSAYDSAALLKPSTGAPARKSLLLAYVLWWFGPAVAAHRFYLGAYRSAFAMAGLFWGGLALGALMSSKGSGAGGSSIPPFWVLMIGAWFVWCLVDAFLIPGLRRQQAERGGEAALRNVFA